MFAVIGEALLDLVQPEQGGPFVAKPGGGPFNVAVGLQRLGHSTQLMARLSTGSLGAIVRAHAESNALGLGSCVSTGDSTTLAFATLDELGKASYDFYVDGTADWGWTAAELAELPARTQAAHTGSLAAAILPGAEAILTLWESLRDKGDVLLSYDPNVRPALVGTRTSAVVRTERFVAASHVVKVSDEDVAWLYPGVALTEVVGRWLESGPALVVMTRGAEGCLAVKKGGRFVQVPGVDVEVVDTIGAGDSFASGLLSAIADAERLHPELLERMSDDELRRVLERAVMVSSMTCERDGADPPTRDEVDARLQRK